MSSKNILVYFIEPISQCTCSAGYNRFLAIVKMVGFNFNYKIIVPTSLRFSKIKLFRGIELRYRYIQSIYVQVKKRNKIENRVLYLFGGDPILNIFFWGFSKVFKIKLICEINELPESIARNKKVLSIFNRIFIYPWYIKIFDGYSLISDELISIFNKYAKKRVLVKLPMTVDFDRFTTKLKSDRIKYLFYSGSLSQTKDGVLSLVRAFIKVSTKLDDLLLYIAYNTKDCLDEINRVINENRMQNKIKLFGYVDRENIPQLIGKSSLCILPRPDSNQAKGGFPTKLGEYLASGRPVITTNVGEIPKYLTSEEVYLISHKNIENELVETIQNIFENYEVAYKKGIMGKIKAFNIFSLESNAIKIRKLITRVIIN